MVPSVPPLHVQGVYSPWVHLPYTTRQYPHWHAQQCAVRTRGVWGRGAASVMLRGVGGVWGQGAMYGVAAATPRPVNSVPHPDSVLLPARPKNCSRIIVINAELL